MIEFVVMSVLYHHRFMLDYAEQQRNKVWREIEQVPPWERRIGIMGLGVLGGDVAAKLVGLGFNVVGWSRGPKELPKVTCFHGADGFVPFLNRSEILVCLLPLTRETENILDARAFAALPKGAALIEKLRQSSKDSLEHLIQVIPETTGLHQAMLTEICLENVEGSNEELFLKSLDNDLTDVRVAAASILAQSDKVNPSKLFKKLHETDVSKTNIIDALAGQAEHLKPEQIIINALKLDKTHAELLLRLADRSEQPLDLDVLRIDPATIESPSIKIMLLRYLTTVDQSEVASLISKFLTDENRTVVIEALKALKNLQVKFDASVLLPFVESLSEVEQEMALEILQAQADADLVGDKLDQLIA